MPRPKIYQIDETYFTRSMTENQAYLLGLVISDGSVNYKRGSFGYVCSKKDKELLEFIKKELKSTHPISEYKIRENIYVKYSITNKNLIQTLIDRWKLPHSNKSKNNIHLLQVGNEYIYHFLRGLFDGDGSIWKSGGTFRAAFSGGEKLMLEIKDILEVNDIPSYLSYRYGKTNKNSCGLTINGTMNASKLGKLLYTNPCCCLERKYQLFNKCFELEIKRRKRLFSLNGSKNKIKKLYMKGDSQMNIAKKLGLVYSSVRACIQKMRRDGEIT